MVRRRSSKPAATPRARVQRPWRVRLALRDWLELGVALVFVAGVAVGVHALRDPQVLPVQTVRVDGPLVHVDPARLQAALLSGLRGNFFTVDLEGLERAVTALPWVARVQIRREWPLALRVRVEEQVAVARWGVDGLLNAQGQVFEPPHLDPDLVRRLPVLYGPLGQSGRVLRAWRSLSRAMRPMGLEPVALYLDERRSWRTWLKDRTEVVLGRGSFDRRLQRLLWAWPRALAAQQGRIERLDLRYTNGLAVRWRPAETEAGGRKTDA